MIKSGRAFCDFCEREMIRATHNDDGDPLWPWRKAHAHICHRCFDEENERAWREDDPCRSLCETQPCERGGDCWYTPDFMRNLPYETYYADTLDDVREAEKDAI